MRVSHFSFFLSFSVRREKVEGGRWMLCSYNVQRGREEEEDVVVGVGG